MITIPTDTLDDARNLVVRLQNVPAFRDYVLHRLNVLLPAGIVIALLIAAAVAAAASLLIALNASLVLPAFLLAPLFFVAGCAVAAYLLLAWMEFLSLGRSLRHSPDPHALSRIPWIPVGVFLVVPLLALATHWWKIGLPLIALGLAMPLLIAHIDRRRR
jgi:polyferredoxin